MISYAGRLKDSGKSVLVFAGQAGFFIKSKMNTIIGVDLYLSNCGERKYGFKRLMPQLFDPYELELDAVVCTHEHYDHFDIDAVPVMVAQRNTRLIAAKDCEKLAKRFEIPQEKTTYLAENDSCTVQDIHIQAVFCDHGEDVPDAIGLVITVDKKSIYFAGDTALRLDKVEEIKKYGPFDIMIAPINGAFGNMNEEEMVKLCEVIAPKIVIPCHYWNFAEHGGNPGIFARKIKELLPTQDYVIMSMGEALEL